MLHSWPMKRSATLLALLAAVSTSALGGCGGGDGADSPAQRTAQEYVDAYNARDFDRVCRLLSGGYKESLLAGEGEKEEEIRCPEWFEEHTSGVPTTLTLVGIEEGGGQAIAHIHSKSEDTPAAENDLALNVQRQPNGAWEVTDSTTYSAPASP
jgi:hypothetical protein